MSPEEYGMVCNRILSETLKYITTENMRRAAIDKSYVDSQDQIYISAAISRSPITIVRTPAGSGKSTLIADRAKALIQSGTPASEIAILSMNIAKASQIAQNLDGVNSMTFSDFIHYVYAANNPQHQLVDDDSFINTLTLCQRTQFRNQFLEKLTIANPLDRTTLLTLFVNNHLEEIETELAALQRASYTIESMVCQNRMYSYDVNPFNLSEIIINGAHNMPIPILCTILEYASRYGCRLYITSAPEETIYDFNMAYGRAINAIEGALGNKDVGTINLIPTHLSDDIYHTMKMDEGARISTSSVQTANVVAKYIESPHDLLTKVIAPGNGYLMEKLKAHEQVLILARSKNDIAELKDIIISYYGPMFPELQVADMTTVQAPTLLWGKVLTKYHKTLDETFVQGITLPALYGKLWEYLAQEIANAPSQNMRQMYQTSQDLLASLSSREWSQDDLAPKQVILRIQTIIDDEAAQIQNHNMQMRNTPLDIESADIIFSTIHSSIDLRIDNTVVYLRNFTNEIDESLYRVALSRARNSEYLIFVNSDNFEVPVQYYLRHHLVDTKGS